MADYVFPASRFTMTADGQKVADFDVQTFPQPNGDICPVVATSANGKGWTWSIYALGAEFVWAEQEKSGDGGLELYDNAIALPRTLQDGQRWCWLTKGKVTYTSPQGSVERGTFVYRNAAWATLEWAKDGSPTDLLYWLEQYTENYGAGDVVYERLHCFSKGEGLQFFFDMQWQGGVKLVVRG